MYELLHIESILHTEYPGGRQSPRTPRVEKKRGRGASLHVQALAFLASRRGWSPITNTNRPCPHKRNDKETTNTWERGLSDFKRWGLPHGVLARRTRGTGICGVKTGEFPSTNEIHSSGAGTLEIHLVTSNATVCHDQESSSKYGADGHMMDWSAECMSGAEGLRYWIGSRTP